MVVAEVVVVTEVQRFDVAVIGGGAAGLSAAVVLGRARRSVVVVDAGSPRNAPAAGVHGFLSRDDIRPAELLEIGREEVAEGVSAAIAINGDLVAEDTRRAVAAVERV